MNWLAASMGMLAYVALASWLDQRTGLRRTTRPQRKTPLRRRTPLRQRRSPNDPTRDVRRIVRDRDGHLCVSCGGRGEQVHHRAGRVGPWAHSPANLILVCGLGNATGCHGLIGADRRWAESLGYRIPRNTSPPIDPATVPVLVHGIGWVLLDDQGGTTATDDPKGEAA